jgi:group I intron endonuclease
MIVYRITNKKNGKSYIGFTSKSVDQRWSEHVYWALHRNSHYRIHAAIRKYGPENFEQYVLAEGSDENYVLNTLEPKFIAEYNTQKMDTTHYREVVSGNPFVIRMKQNKRCLFTTDGGEKIAQDKTIRCMVNIIPMERN